MLVGVFFYFFFLSCFFNINIYKKACCSGCCWNCFYSLYFPGQHKQFLLELFSFPLQLCFKAPAAHLQTCSPLFCHLNSKTTKKFPSICCIFEQWFFFFDGGTQTKAELFSEFFVAFHTFRVFKGGNFPVIPVILHSVILSLWPKACRAGRKAGYLLCFSAQVVKIIGKSEENACSYFQRLKIR